MCINLI